MNAKAIKLLFFLILTLVGFTVNGQKKGFVATSDGVYQQGRIVFDSDNPTTVQLIVSEQDQRTYVPAQLRSFGYLRFLSFRDSTIYESAEIQLEGRRQSLFLLQLVGGENGLLELKRDDSKLYHRGAAGVNEITRDNYKNLLDQLTRNKPFWVYQTSKIKFNKLHLSLFFRALNEEKSPRINLPQTSVHVGLNMATAQIEENLVASNQFGIQNLKFTNEYYGISLSSPLFKSSRIRLINQLSFEKHNLVGQAIGVVRTQNLHIRFNRFLLESTPSYQLTSGRFSPYILAGPIIGFVQNVQSEIFNTQVQNQNQIVHDSKMDFARIESLQLGVTAGLGFDFYLVQKITLGAEIRVNGLKEPDGIFTKYSLKKFNLKISF